MKHITSNTNKLKIGLLGLLAFCTVASGASFAWSQHAAALSLPPVTGVADTVDNCKKDFLGLKPWYYFMPSKELRDKSNPTDPCGVHCFNIFVQADTNPNECGQTASDVPGIVLAIIDDLLRVAGLVAIAFIIVGAFQYVGSRGNAERTAQAQTTIVAALTGLAVTLVAVGFVSFLGNQLGG